MKLLSSALFLIPLAFVPTHVAAHTMHPLNCIEVACDSFEDLAPFAIQNTGSHTHHCRADL